MNTCRYWRKAIFVLVTLVLLLQLATTVSASTVLFRAGRVQVASGAMVLVPVEVVGAPGIGPLHLELAYDPEVLTAVEVTKGVLLKNAIMESSVTGRGRVVAAIVAADPIKGDGVVVNVRFKAIEVQGQQSALSLEGVKAWERGNGHDVMVNTEAGQATVTADYTMWILVVVVCVLSLVVLGGGLIAFLLLKRR